nr:hypothetical protein [Tanacetum cinerariifolium]
MVNVIPPNHVDDVPVVEPDQHDDVPNVPEPVLVDEDEDPKEDEVEEEEDPQEEEDDMEVENLIEHEDETIPASIHEVGESATSPFLHKDSDGLLPAHALVEKKGKAKDEFYVEKLGNAEDKVECKKLKKELEEASLATYSFDLCLKKDRMKLSLFRLKMRKVHHLSREDLLIMLSSSVSIMVSLLIMPSKSAPLTQAAIRRMIKCNPTAFHGTEGAVKLMRWFEKNESVLESVNIQRAKRLAEFYPIDEIQRMEHGLWNLKVKEYKIVAYTQRFNELALLYPRMVEPERVKVDAYIQGLTDNIKGELTFFRLANLNEAVRIAHKLMDQKAHARDEKILEGKKRKKVGHKSSYYEEKNVATGANALPIPTCYDCGKQGHTRNQCPKKVKQEEVGEVRGRAYVIKDAEPKGPNVVTGTFLLNNRYAFVLFDLDFDRSFVDTRSMNHVLEIDLMLIELGTLNVIISMDWLVKHDAVIVYGERVVRIPYGKKILIVESDKGVSRLKVISFIKAHVPVIRDFREVFPKELPGLPPPRQVEFQIDLVPRAAPVAHATYILTPSEMKELSDEKEHEKHLKIILELLKKERFGVHMDPAKVKAIKSWAAPTTLTDKNKKYKWGKEEEEDFQTLKQKLCSTPILALPEGKEDFVVYCDASLKGYGAVLMQREKYILNQKELNLRRESLSDYNCEIRKCRSHVCWSEVGDSQLTGPELIRDTTEKTVHIKNRLLVARSRQKSYTDKRAKSLEFEVGDMVLLKVSPWKGAMRFRKQRKLSPCYIGPFKILARVGLVA